MTQSQKVAEDKARKALEAIEQAQRLLSKACEELCPLDGLCPEWEDVGAHYDKVKALWHRVNLRVNGGGFDLDQNAKRKLGPRLVSE